MPWNHRVLRFLPETDDEYYEIRECHYDEGTPKDSIPHSWSAEPCALYNEDVEGLGWILQKMQDCLKKPVLEEDGDKLKEVKDDG